MTTTTRVVRPDTGTAIEEPVRTLSLRAKLLAASLLVVAPSAVLAALAGTQWLAGDPRVSWMVGGTVSMGPLAMSPYQALVVGVALASIAAGYVIGGRIFVRPITRLLDWVRKAKDAAPEATPILPRLPRDETGDLAQAVGSLSARVFRETERNKDLIGEKSLFLTIAAHQLRTPLTGLTWSVAELLNPLVTGDAREKLLQELNTMLKRMQLVINHLLASANVEEGRFGYVIERVDIVPVVQGLIDGFRPVAEDRNVSLSFEHDPALPQVYADSERMSLALFDLISNAIDYTPSGGSITVTLKPEKDRVEVSIADTGIGIPEKEMPFLFTKFYRGDSARHLRPNGSGLGLFLVKNIVSSHGSEIRVESNASLGGSRFSFSLGTKRAP